MEKLKSLNIIKKLYENDSHTFADLELISNDIN